MREMLGGCCVCSDDRGWSENPLVYCDGQFCNVAVHQACYGIVSVPTGPWYCCKCESQERSNKVKCELCPSKHGALKRTDNQGWAHVVCALYIPEVRFGNVSTMEPIQLHLIPQERFSKVCYICKEKGKPANSTVGACMQCNRVGCKQQFHVTCAQSLGLLCEEAGNYLDNVKYCGYCQHHYSKLKKGGNVKTIPPYKPVNESQNSDSNSEKESSETGNSLKNSPSHMSSKRKSGSNSKNSSSSKSTTTSSGKTSSSQQQKTIHSNIESAGDKRLSNSLKSAKSEEAATTTATPSSSPSADKSDKKDSRSDSISESEKDSKDNNKSVSGTSSSSSSNKKRKSNNSRTPTPIQSEVSVVVSALSASDLSNMNISCSTIAAASSSSSTTTTTSATVTQKTSSSASSSSVSLNEGTTAEKLKRAKLESTQLIISNQPVVALTSISTTKVVTSSANSTSSSSSDSAAHIQVLPAAVPSTASIIQTSSSSISTQQHPSLLVSVPLSNASIAPLAVTSSSGAGSSFATADKIAATSMQQNISERSSSSSAISNIIISSNNQGILTSEMSGGGLKITYEKQPLIDSGHTEVDMELELDAPTLVQELPSKRIARSHSHDKSERGKGRKRHSLGSNGFSTMQGSTSMPATLNKKSANNNNRSSDHSDQSYPNPPILSIVQPGAFAAISQDKLKDSPPSSPNSESQGAIPTSVMRGRTKGRKSAPAAVNVIQGRSKDDKKDVKIFQNGITTAPHMLGNQLNPTSNMHQKMTDHLSNELEAHSIYNNSNDGSPTLIGPQLHHRVLQSARASSTGSSTASGGSGLSSMLGNGGGTIPQTLDQLLERQWEQGSQFLMEQAQHFDIASLLSCLHQLRAENLRLEEHVSSLLQRRDHLLAVNARLAIPLTGQPAVVPNSQSSHTVNNIHPGLTVNHADMSRTPRLGVGSYDRYPQGTLTVPVENGLTPDSYSNNLHNRDSVSSGQPSPTVRHSPAAPYSNNGLLRQCPDPGRDRPSAPRPHSYTVYERPGSAHSASSTPQMVIRRERDRDHDIFGHTSQQPS